MYIPKTLSIVYINNNIHLDDIGNVNIYKNPLKNLNISNK